MAHIHSVYDTDPHFTIDPSTRGITNLSTTKVRIMQFDHNSERFTFEIPRYVDGHDMSTCNRVEIHFKNTSSATKEVSADLYIVNDMQISPDDEDVVIFSWLIEGVSTMYAGPLDFHISFKCMTDLTIDYVWGTDIFKGMSVGDGLNNGEAVTNKYSDVIGDMIEEAVEQRYSDLIRDMVNEAVAKKFSNVNSYTDSRTTITGTVVKAIGGIPGGEKYEKESIVKVLSDLLFKEVSNYVAVTSDTTPPTSYSSSVNDIGTSNSATVTTQEGNYIWFLMRDTSQDRIQHLLEGTESTWMTLDTTYEGPITFTTSSGSQHTYYAYRTPELVAATEKYRII